MDKKILIAALIVIAVGYYVSKEQIKAMEFLNNPPSKNNNIRGYAKRCIGQIV